MGGPLQALPLRDGELVGRLLKRVPLSEVFDENGVQPPRMPVPVMVALLKHLAGRLGTDAELKLKWVDQLILNVNVGSLPKTTNYGGILVELQAALADLVKKAEAAPKDVAVTPERIRTTLQLVNLLVRSTPALTAA